jgi:arsenate reductase
MARVLFVCRQNAGRSQISQALFQRAAHGRHEARSAGTTPAGHVHPVVIEVMEEVGIDLRPQTPARLTPELAEWSDLVVTMGCGDECPYIPGKRYLDWDLADPAGQAAPEVRALREDIAGRVAGLLEELDHPTPPRGLK